jgi:general secretion pathway protein H
MIFHTLKTKQKGKHQLSKFVLHPFHSGHRQSGMTLIEIVVVVGLIALVYAVAAPDLLLNDQAERQAKISRISEDVRSAYDTAVLSGRAHRLVFDLTTSDYWLESTEAEHFFLGNQELDRDLTEEEENQENLEFDEKFVEYEQLAGSEITDPEDDQVIRPTSPLLRAKDRLKRPVWAVVESGEWSRRSLSPELKIISMQAEHHRGRQSLESTGEGGRAMIYFFPQGYVEKAVIYVNDPEATESDRPPYTIVTEPYEGVAELLDEYQEIDVSRDAQKRS